jgi:uncharacterized protein YcbK (DUF882 family)
MGDLTEHFSRSEFDCKCGCGRNGIKMALVEKLEKVRQMLGKRMVVTSGYRCLKHNGNVGSTTSSHVKGLAADIACSDSSARDELVGFLRTEFNRMGIAKDFIHVDVDEHKASPVLWVY